MNKNILMIVAAAAVLVSVNVGVFMAAGNGVISPINNILLWGAFVALNVASILWAVSMLGLQPLVVTVSYVAGGALAFLGVRGMGSDISVAEITTAGATYGAFGALAVGNVTTKVRLAFFNKGQVPFIFIITGLLVVDAILNSQVSSAGVSVLLNAVLLPFVIAGGAVGLIWSVVNNRLGISKTPREVLAEKDAAVGSSEPAKASAAQKAAIPMPKQVIAKEESAPVVKPVKKIKKVEPVAPAAKAKPKPVAPAATVKPKPVAKPDPIKTPEPIVAKAAPVEEEKAFFPLEIDKNAETTLPEKSPVMAEEKPFEIPTFNAADYGSVTHEIGDDGSVVMKEPSASVETPPEQSGVDKASAATDASVKPKTAEKSDDDNFLDGHLDLLNKLK